jgi:hypothetical protein
VIGVKQVFRGEGIDRVRRKQLVYVLVWQLLTGIDAKLLQLFDVIEFLNLLLDYGSPASMCYQGIRFWWLQHAKKLHEVDLCLVGVILPWLL